MAKITLSESQLKQLIKEAINEVKSDEINLKISELKKDEDFNKGTSIPLEKYIELHSWHNQPAKIAALYQVPVEEVERIISQIKAIPFLSGKKLSQ